MQCSVQIPKIQNHIAVSVHCKHLGLSPGTKVCKCTSLAGAGSSAHDTAVQLVLVLGYVFIRDEQGAVHAGRGWSEGG